jgi:cyclase
MRRIRVIPVLGLMGSGLVKTRKFGDPKYVGDPINAVKIFNDKSVDELMFLDIRATKEKKPPNMKVIREIASECFMPVAYGGGVQTYDQAREIITAGIEKIVFNSAFISNPATPAKVAEVYGAQSVVCVMDAKKNLWGKWMAWTSSGSMNTKLTPLEFARRAEEYGAGELVVNDISRDGEYTGYNIELIREISSKVSIPVVALGGARGMDDFKLAVEAGASAVAAGARFVFHGPHRAVLINYPSPVELKEWYNKLH